MSTTSPEGVTRFEVHHVARALDPRIHGEVASTLLAWREILSHLRLLGRDPARYEGLGYGNVSARLGPFGAVPRGQRRFLVTGTQTAGVPHAGLGEFCVVESWDIARNRVESVGPVPPSSESLTHAAIYDVSPATRVVLHVHAPDIWRHGHRLGLPVTRETAANGTAGMALEVQRLLREGTFESTRVAVMGGHEDGVLAIGRNAAEAGLALVAQLARARTGGA